MRKYAARNVVCLTPSQWNFTTLHLIDIAILALLYLYGELRSNLPLLTSVLRLLENLLRISVLMPGISLLIISSYIFEQFS